MGLSQLKSGSSISKKWRQSQRRSPRQISLLWVNEQMTEIEAVMQVMSAFIHIRHTQ